MWDLGLEHVTVRVADVKHSGVSDVRRQCQANQSSVKCF